MGGAAGHLIHPFEDSVLTTFDLRQMFDDIVNNRVDLYEKVDGYNLHVSMRGGTMVIARNKTTAVRPITIEELPDMFKEEHVKQIFFEAAESLERAFLNVHIHDLDGFLNVEILDPRTNRLFDYGKVIQAHWISHFDDKGNIIRTSDAKPLVDELEDSEYDIRGPNKMQVVLSDIDKYHAKRARFDSGVFEGHVSITDIYWNRLYDDERMRPFTNLGAEVIDMIVDRWLNKTPNMKEIKKHMTPEQSKLFTHVDKHDRYKIMRKARWEMERDVANYGAFILKHCQTTLSQTSTDRISEKVDEIWDHLEELGSEEIRHLFRTVDHDLLVNYEGVVFEWGGRTYKLTGIYGVVNILVDELQRNQLEQMV